MSAIGLLFIWFFWNKYQETRRGFWIRYISPNILRADPEDFAIEYHEGEKSLMLYGKLLEGPKRRVTIPSMHEWEAKMPEWAKDRREEIRGRIKADLNPKVYEIGE